MCNKNFDLREFAREVFSLGAKAGAAGMLESERSIDAPDSNVVSIESLRANRAQRLGVTPMRRATDVTSKELDA